MTDEIFPPRTQEEVDKLLNGVCDYLDAKAEEITCTCCDARFKCLYAFDPYNTSGDCLAEK